MLFDEDARWREFEERYWKPAFAALEREWDEYFMALLGPLCPEERK